MVMQHFSGHLFLAAGHTHDQYIGSCTIFFWIFLVQGDVKDTYLNVG